MKDTELRFYKVNGVRFYDKGNWRGSGRHWSRPQDISGVMLFVDKNRTLAVGELALALKEEIIASHGKGSLLRATDEVTFDNYERDEAREAKVKDYFSIWK